ncbi:unnamed protein product [marine sediment metagenome]|uniref:Uncharacterized protein n=1 Tax=marine sediment metagenome TaxID=412755 RepID=X1BKC3_9ZZZZ
MSENAKAVAKEVIATVRNGEKVNMQKIQQKHGYTKCSAKSMKAKETQSYKDAIKPLAVRLRAEVNRIASELETKDLTLEKYTDLTNSLDKLNKNLQLVEGKPTEIHKHELSQEEEEAIDDLLD